MGMNPVDGEGRHISLASLDPTPRKRAEPKEAPPDKPLDGPTTKTEVTRALASVYNLLHKVVHDDVRYSPSDFSEEADGFVELMQRHAQLRVVMRIIAPIAALGAIYDKVEGTIDRFRDRQRRAAEQRERERVADAARKTHAPTVVIPVQAEPTATVIDEGDVPRGPGFRNILRSTAYRP